MKKWQHLEDRKTFFSGAGDRGRRGGRHWVGILRCLTFRFGSPFIWPEGRYSQILDCGFWHKSGMSQQIPVPVCIFMRSILVQQFQLLPSFAAELSRHEWGHNQSWRAGVASEHCLVLAPPCATWACNLRPLTYARCHEARDTYPLRAPHLS